MRDRDIASLAGIGKRDEEAEQAAIPYADAAGVDNNAARRGRLGEFTFDRARRRNAIVQVPGTCQPDGEITRGCALGRNLFGAGGRCVARRANGGPSEGLRFCAAGNTELIRRSLGVPPRALAEWS